MLLRWSGFADLVFAESAPLAFARAAELAETDVHEQHRDAWLIDDRHLTFSLESESTRPTIEAMKRFLGLLALQAEGGEAVIEIAEPRERWLRRPAPLSISKDLDRAVEDEAPQSRTIRVSAGRAFNG